MLRNFDHECDIILSSIRGQAGKKTYINNLFVFHSNKCKIKERDPSIFSAKGKEECTTFIQRSARTLPACFIGY